VGWSGDFRDEVESILRAKCLIYKAFGCPAVSHVVPLDVHGVQGVASSNPATPTNEINALAVRSR
jgi:hypothetical protein